MVAKSKQLGDAGEDAAEKFLKNSGFKILQRNWRQGRWEIDIIALEKDVLVFFEVKTRTHGGISSPIDAINVRKKNAMLKAITMYLTQYKLWSKACRIDILCLEWNGETFSIEHYRNAFDFYASDKAAQNMWQPW